MGLGHHPQCPEDPYHHLRLIQISDQDVAVARRRLVGALGKHLRDHRLLMIARAGLTEDLVDHQGLFRFLVEEMNDCHTNVPHRHEPSHITPQIIVHFLHRLLDHIMMVEIPITSLHRMLIRGT